MTREMLRYIGVNPRRLALEWISAAEGGRFAKLMNEFDATIRELGAFGSSEEFDANTLNRKLDAAMKAAGGKKLRWVVGKYTEFTTEGNKYGEVFTRHEMNRTLRGIIKEEVDSWEIRGMLEEKPQSVKELAAGLNIEPPLVMRYISAMRKKGEVGIKEVKDRSPIYESLPAPPQTEPRKKVEAKPLPKKESKGDKTVVVLGASPAGVEAALQEADSGKNVLLVDTTPGASGARVLQDENFEGDAFASTRYKEAREHPAIQVVPLATLRRAKAVDGKFELKFDTVPKRIEPEKCDDCGACFKACPISLWDAYDQELSLRTAVDRFSEESAAYNVVKEEMPICQATCPVHVDIRGYVGLLADGKPTEALGKIRDRLPFPSICGRVCAHPCEDACNRGKVDEPIAICALKRYAADCEMNECFDIEVKKPEKVRKEKVAVIGGGPAGLACAHDLARQGYRVTVFEALPVAGGMLYVGIPEYRLPKKILGREVDMVRALGVEIKTGVRVGKDIPFEQLRKDFDAIFVGIGCHKGLMLDVPGEDLDGVIDCVTFLRQNNLGEGVPVRDRLVVIGGGNAAIDAARVGRRLGYKEVHIVYRRTRKEMPANAWEIDEAEHEGVKITYLAAPVEILGKDGRVTAIKCIRMELGEPDASGRRRPVPVEGSEFDIECDIVVPALSQKTDLEGLQDKGVNFSRKGTVVADEDTLETTLEGVYAGGDAVTGPGLAIEAIAQGKQAAVSIDRYLRSRNGE